MTATKAGGDRLADIVDGAMWAGWPATGERLDALGDEWDSPVLVSPGHGVAGGRVAALPHAGLPAACAQAEATR